MKKLLVTVCMLSVAQTSQTMETAMKINKAVIPAAGLGTRFLPYTKSIPKEMLPILEKPSIQLIIEEGLGCGINDFIVIANDDKQALKNFLSHQPTLENELAERGKLDLLAGLNHDIDSAQFKFVPQPKALGLGHAVLQTKDAVGDEYFGIFLPDEIMVGEVPALA